MDDTHHGTTETQQKFVLQMPLSLYEAIKTRAQDEDRSMASWVRRVCAEALNGHPQQT